MPQLLSPRTLESVLRGKRSPHITAGEEPLLAATREKPTHSNKDPALTN